MSLVMRKILSFIEWLGVEPNEPVESRLQKTILVGSAFMMSTAGFLWGLLYLVNREVVAAAIPLSYGLLSYLSLLVFRFTRRYEFFRTSQLVFSLLLPFGLLLALGGYAGSSAVIMWSFTSPVGALLFAGRRPAVRWFLAYLALVAASGLAQPFIEPTNNLSEGLVITLYVLNITGLSIVAFVLLHYFIGQKDEAMRLLTMERQKSEQLLLNVLPAKIAQALKEGQGTIAEHFDSASILFADMVGFTRLTASLEPWEMVGLLNEIYSAFDELVRKYAVEKIRTVGDNYMVASGVPHPRPDHAEALAALALDMCSYLERLAENGRQVKFRIGINSGPVVGGVIGQEKFHYDVWGDAVNIASRMESHGEPGRVQITPETYALIGDKFLCEPYGPVEIKGVGEMQTWFLVSRKA